MKTILIGALIVLKVISSSSFKLKCIVLEEKREMSGVNSAHSSS